MKELDIKCKFCGQPEEVCICIKTRLILRKSIADYNGKFVEYKYKTIDILLPPGCFWKDTKTDWEIIAGEWR